MAKPDPRYLAIAEAEQKPKKKAGSGLLLVRNLIILGGICYGGWFLIPSDDKAELLEMVEAAGLPELPVAAGPAPAPQAVADAAAPASGTDGAPTAAPTPSANSGGGFLASLLALLGGGGSDGAVSANIDIRHFPLAYDNWRRTDYLHAETAPQAMRRMDRLLGSGRVDILPLEEVRARKAAIYRAGRQELLIFLEAGIAPPPPAAAVVSTEAGAPAVLEAPAALAPDAEPAAVAPVTVAAAEPLIESALPSAIDVAAPTVEPETTSTETAADDPLPTIVIEGVTFTDHAAKRRGVIDLRAQLDRNRAIYVRGRTSMRVVERFLSQTDLARMGMTD